MPAARCKIRDPRGAGRRGITLIELLIVMTILSIVTAASIPLLTTGVGQRRVREAARLVSSYIGAARSRAIETGRPAGVMIQRYAGQAMAMNLVTVEVPPPYGGDTTNSGAFINTSGAITGLGTPSTTTGSGTPGTSDTGWQSLVRVGDIIQFGYQGRSYMLLGTATPPTAMGTLPTLSNTGQFLTTSSFPCYLWATDGSLAVPAATQLNFAAPATGAPGASYQIFRQPTKSAVQPLQLPEGTMIDVSQSGIGLTGLSATFQNNAPFQNPIITFGPTGAVGLAYFDNNPPQHLTSTFYLLISRIERAGINDENDLGNMWVAVGPQSGSVVTAENMGGSLSNARQFAQQASSMGGR